MQLKSIVAAAALTSAFALPAVANQSQAALLEAVQCSGKYEVLYDRYEADLVEAKKTKSVEVVAFEILKYGARERADYFRYSVQQYLAALGLDDHASDRLSYTLRSGAQSTWAPLLGDSREPEWTAECHKHLPKWLHEGRDQ